MSAASAGAPPMRSAAVTSARRCGRRGACEVRACMLRGRLSWHAHKRHAPIRGWVAWPSSSCWDAGLQGLQEHGRAVSGSDSDGLAQSAHAPRPGRAAGTHTNCASAGCPLAGSSSWAAKAWCLAAASASSAGTYGPPAGGTISRKRPLPVSRRGSRPAARRGSGTSAGQHATPTPCSPLLQPAAPP